jgi:hypothetical protein
MRESRSRSVVTSPFYIIIKDTTLLRYYVIEPEVYRCTLSRVAIQWDLSPFIRSLEPLSTRSGCTAPVYDCKLLR